MCISLALLQTLYVVVLSSFTFLACVSFLPFPRFPLYFLILPSVFLCVHWLMVWLCWIIMSTFFSPSFLSSLLLMFPAVLLSHLLPEAIARTSPISNLRTKRILMSQDLLGQTPGGHFWTCWLLFPLIGQPRCTSLSSLLLIWMSMLVCFSVLRLFVLSNSFFILFTPLQHHLFSLPSPLLPPLFYSFLLSGLTSRLVSPEISVYFDLFLGELNETKDLTLVVTSGYKEWEQSLRGLHFRLWKYLWFFCVNLYCCGVVFCV